MSSPAKNEAISDGGKEAPKPPAGDIRQTLDAFLGTVYRASVESKHETPVPLDTLVRELSINERLAEKIAAFLEVEGLIDYDDQAVDITIDGMLRAEEILRGDKAPAPSAGAKA